MKKMLSMSLLALALTGCKDKYTNTYLMQHPEFLNNAVIDCQSNRDKSDADMAQCKIVMSAYESLAPVVYDSQRDPERFGQRVLDEQEALADLKETMQRAELALNELHKQNASATEIQAAQDKLNLAKKTYHEKKENIQILLGVLALGSPE